jgi:flagellar biosynthesis component FlhA
MQTVVGFDLAVLATQALIVLALITAQAVVLVVLLDGLWVRMPRVILDMLLIALSIEALLLAVLIGACSIDLSAFPYLRKIFYGL